ncbi:DUF1573 domain-containing protein [Sphingobacterium pedocola]|uniref:DUF1573 domain-containing protein n=1 Tax=Sphingobacterium pedocola TaxID=2082722 RepID=A0ABR9TB55_9SPHI|nr:DUF1573 domain-containing protein [Sphingobacterium pedocola]MBE8722578.1 hypothetical protein [Sphingobacterium pedocola]
MKFKQLGIGLAAVVFFAACSNQPKTEEASKVDPTEVSTPSENTKSLSGKGKIEFEEDAFDFGTVKEGEVVDHVFEFKNTGEEPVIISAVSASCGCTTPDYTKDPVLPGKEGEIKVAFNSEGQVGTQQKIITVSSNATNKVTTVQIKGTVVKNK